MSDSVGNSAGVAGDTTSRLDAATATPSPSSTTADSNAGTTQNATTEKSESEQAAAVSGGKSQLKAQVTKVPAKTTGATAKRSQNSKSSPNKNSRQRRSRTRYRRILKSDLTTSSTQINAATLIQKHVRGVIARSAFVRRKAATVIQVRCFMHPSVDASLR